MVRTVAELLAGKALVAQVDTGENRSLAGRFGVRAIPVLMLLKGGKVVDQLPGVRSADAVLAWFRQHV